MRSNLNKLRYYLLFKFKAQNIFASLYRFFGKTYFALRPGLFINLFNKKKTLKKKKVIHFVMMRYIKKLLSVVQIFNVTFVVKNPPFYLNKLLTVFNLPFTSPFLNPLTNKSFDETSPDYGNIKFKYFFFINSKSYTFSKVKKRGRIKRKIRRKLILKNRIID